MPRQKTKRASANKDKPAATKSARTPKRKPASRKGDRRTKEQTLNVTLSGSVYQRGNRWWWRVKLPGEDTSKARPLKAPGDKAATSDRKAAETIAFDMWERAVREDAGRQIALQSTDKIEKLKAQFLDKVRHFTELVDTANTKAEKEAKARAELEARLEQVTRDAVPATGVCECCGAAGLSLTDLTQIDSGQALCPTCLAVLRADATQNRPDASQDVL